LSSSEYTITTFSANTDGVEYHTGSAINGQQLVYAGKVLIESFKMLVSNVYIFLPTYFSYTANQVQAESENPYYILGVTQMNGTRK
jgi:hypothetical protein